MNWLHSFLLFVAAFAAVFLEASFGGVRHWLGAQIDLLPALMLYAGLSSSFGVMTALAVLGGLWFDSLSANPLGTSTLPLFLVGLVIYARRGLILREQFFAQYVLGLAASAFVPLFALFMLLTTGHAPMLGWGSLWQWLVMTMGGGVLTPVCFLLFDALNRALNYQPVSQSSFRPDREIRRGRS